MLSLLAVGIERLWQWLSGYIHVRCCSFDGDLACSKHSYAEVK